MIKLEPCHNTHHEESFTDDSNSSNVLPSQMIKLEPPYPINYEESNLQNSDCIGIHTFSIKEEEEDQLNHEEQCENDYSNEISVKIEPSIELDEVHDEGGNSSFNSNTCSKNVVNKLSEIVKNDNDDGNSEDSFHLSWDDDMLKGATETSEDSDGQNKELHEEVERTNIFGESSTPWKIKIEDVEPESTSAKKKRTKRRKRKKLLWSKNKKKLSGSSFNRKEKEKYFKCTYCTRSFCSRDSLDYHMNIHNEMILVCNYCKFFSIKVYIMRRHVENIHKLHSIKLGIDYFCKNLTEARLLCDRKEELNDELTDGSGKESKSENCLLSLDIKRETSTNDCLYERGKDEKCNLEMFSSYFESLLNQKFKINVDNCELQCFVCLLILDTLPSLMIHIFRNHFVPKLFECNICEYSRYFPLIFHPVVESKHECNTFLNEKIEFESNPSTNTRMPVTNEFRCGLCDSASIHSITSHMRSVHCQLKQFHCKHCDLKIYYPLVILEKGELLHHCKQSEFVSKKYCCLKCGFSRTVTAKRWKYLEHRHKCAVQIFFCTKCNFSRAVNAKRWKYLQDHHICADGNNRNDAQELNNSNIPKRYSCIKCGFSRTVTAKRWKYLKRRHSCADKIFFCTKCNFSTQVTAKRWKYLKDNHVCADGNNRKDPQELNNSNIPKRYFCIKCGFSRTVTAKRWKYLEYIHVCADGNNRNDLQELNNSNIPRRYYCRKCGFSKRVTAKRWKYLEDNHICADGNNRNNPQELNNSNIPRSYSCIKCGFSRTVTAKRWKYLEYHHVCADGNKRNNLQELNNSNIPRRYYCRKCGFSRAVTAKRWEYLKHRHSCADKIFFCTKCGFSRTVTAKRLKYLEDHHICTDGNNRNDPQEINNSNIPRRHFCLKCGFSRRVTAEKWKCVMQNHKCVGKFLKKKLQQIRKKLGKLKKNDKKRRKYIKNSHICVDKKNSKDSQGLQKSIQIPPKKKLGLKCGHCDYVLSSQNDLYIHRLAHENKKFLTCKLCPYSSYGITSMRKHVKTFHGEDYKGSGSLEVTDANSLNGTGIKKIFMKDKVNGEGWNCFDVHDEDNESTDSSPEVADLINSIETGTGKEGAKDKVAREELNGSDVPGSPEVAEFNNSNEAGIEKEGAKDKVTREELNSGSGVPAVSQTEEFKVNAPDKEGCNYQNEVFHAELDHTYFLPIVKRKCNSEKSCAAKSPLQTKASTFNSSIETNTGIAKEQCSVSSVTEEKVESIKAVKKTEIPREATKAVKKKKVLGRSSRRLKSKLENKPYSFVLTGINEITAKLKSKPYSFVSGIDKSVLPTISFTEEAPTPGGNQHLKDAWDELTLLTFDHPENDFNDPQEDPLAVKDDSSKDEMINNTKQIIWKRMKIVYMSHDLDIPEEHKVQKQLYGCEVCEKLYYNKMEIARHSEEHDRLLCINDKEDGILECSFCNFTTVSKSSLRWHKFKHHALSITNLSCCPICSYTVESNNMMSDHIYRDHSCGTISKCILCEHDYNKVLITHDHRAIMGLSDNTSCCCEVCYDVFHSKNDFLLHVLDNHSNNNPSSS